MRRCKKCTHKISFWKYLTVWRPVLPLFPRTQMPPVCSPSWAPCRGCWKVSGCSDWFNPCRGRWQGLLFSRSVVSDSLRPHGLQHARPPCPSPPPGTCSNSCPSSQWCHPTLSSHGVSDAIRPSHPIESVMPSNPLIPSSQWCHPTLSSSVVPFSRLQSFPASGSFPMGRFSASGGRRYLWLTVHRFPSPQGDPGWRISGLKEGKPATGEGRAGRRGDQRGWFLPSPSLTPISVACWDINNILGDFFVCVCLKARELGVYIYPFSAIGCMVWGLRIYWGWSPSGKGMWTPSTSLFPRAQSQEASWWRYSSKRAKSFAQSWPEGSAGNAAERQSHWLECSLRDCPAEDAITYRLCGDAVCCEIKAFKQRGRKAWTEGGRREKEEDRKKRKRKKGTEGGKEDWGEN